MKMRWVTWGLVGSLLVATACSDSNTGRVGFALSSRRAPSTLSGAVTGFHGSLSGSGLSASVQAGTASGPTVVALGNDTIIIQSAQLVLRKIELERSELSTSCADVEPEVEGCEEFEAGPLLVSLPLGNTTEQLIAVSVPAGTYEKVEFEIHKPDASKDAAFITAHADFANLSIQVTGTFVHGTGSGAGARSDFVFTSAVDAEQEMALVPPLVVVADASTNVTLRVDVATWFLDESKTALLDPSTANPSVVANNIEKSFEAFRDNNEDGFDDDKEGS